MELIMSKLAPAFFTLIALCLFCIPVSAKSQKPLTAFNMDNCMREKAKTIPDEKKQRKICLKELGITSNTPK